MTPFVVLSHGRSGSTLLVRSLDEHPDVVCYAELFNSVSADRVSALTRKYIDNEEPSSFCRNEVYVERPGVLAVGFKLHVNQMHATALEQRLWEFLQSQRDCRIVFLVRDNLFDSYVSNQRAQRSGHWRRSPKETVAKKYLAPLNIDVDHCQSVMRWQKSRIEATKAKFRLHRIINISYEELNSNYQSTLDNIFEFLDVHSCIVNPPLGRMNIVPHQTGIVNYDEVKAHFAGSEFAGFFN